MTARLSMLAMEHWATLDGYAVGHGVPDLRTLSLARFTNFVWWFFTRNGAETEVEKFRARLWRPPVGEVPDARSPWSAENEAASFAAVKRSLGQ